MGAQTQIDRIKNNVQNSFTALQEKGVSVPVDANSDSLPALIAQVTSGVYVGSGDMPDNCNVQIDPSGEGTLLHYEEWTFTLEDGSTVTKKVAVW